MPKKLNQFQKGVYIRTTLKSNFWYDNRISGVYEKAKTTFDEFAKLIDEMNKGLREYKFIAFDSVDPKVAELMNSNQIIEKITIPEEWREHDE